MFLVYIIISEKFSWANRNLFNVILELPVLILITVIVGAQAGKSRTLIGRWSPMALQASLTLQNESKQAAELMQPRSIRGS